MKRFQYKKGDKQRGIATLLILILVGVAVSAAVFGSLRYIQGSQNQTTALHAQTQAQITTWSGVEVIYQYLKNISPGDMAALITAAESATSTDPVEVDFDGMSALSAGFYKDGGDLYALITGTTEAGTRAQSTSTVEVVYHGVAPNPNEPEGGGGDCAPFCSDAPPSVITFNRDLRLGGNINVTKQQGESYQINVKGVVTTGGNSITGVDNINATDSIQIGSGSTYKNLRSNGDIAITGSVTVSESMRALGNICVTGNGQSPGLTVANGFVYGIGSAGFGELKSRGQSTYDGSNPECNNYERTDSSGKIFGVWLAGNNVVDKVETMGSVAHDSGNIKFLRALGDLHLTGKNPTVATLDKKGSISGVAKKCESSNLNNCSGSIPPNVHVEQNGSPSVSVSQLAAIDVQTTTFDAYDYEQVANYVFKPEGSSRIKVTVRNIEGIDPGDYYLLPLVRIIRHEHWTESATYADYLCKSIDGSGNCLDKQEKRKTICKTTNTLVTYPVYPEDGKPSAGTYTIPGNYANSSSNRCVKYESGEWIVGGSGSTPSFAQGIVWFEGDVAIGAGEFYNTLIATGNIKTSGNHKNAAPNFAGPSGNNNPSLKGVCSNAYFPHYPTQICDAFNEDAPLPIANYAYMASGNIGVNPGGGGSSVYGSVLAGNDFYSGGNANIYGFITALAAGTATGNIMGATTNIIVNQLPPTYIPMGGISTGSGPGQGDGSGSGEPVCNSPVCLAGDTYIATKFSARYR